MNGNYALEAGLKVNKDALATEDADSIGAKTYGNIVAVKKGNEKTDATKALIKALKSDTVKNISMTNMMELLYLCSKSRKSL